MANTYAANFGDVVKHAVLCEVLVRQRPERYLESHGGRLDYRLAELDPGPGGVWDFLEAAPGSEVLDGSVYAERLRAEVGRPDRPGTYPGSIALAASLLPVGAPVIAFELVESSAAQLADGLSARGRAAEIEVADGLAGVCRLASGGDLVLLDPFDVHDRSGGRTAAEAFTELARNGVPTMLWYAIYEPDESDGWIEAAIPGPVTDAWRARLVGSASLGGLAGCGFLTAHLSADAEAAAGAVVEALAASLAPVRPGLHVI